MAANPPSAPINGKTNPDSAKNRAPSQPHEYTSLQDLLELPCTCSSCTYVRRQPEPGSRPEPRPQLSDSLVTRFALAMLLPIPDPPRFRSKRLAPQRFSRGLRAPTNATLEFLNRHVVAAISRASGRLIGAVQATEDEEDATPRGRLPFVTC